MSGPPSQQQPGEDFEDVGTMPDMSIPMTSVMGRTPIEGSVRSVAVGERERERPARVSREAVVFMPDFSGHSGFDPVSDSRVRAYDYNKIAILERELDAERRKVDNLKSDMDVLRNDVREQQRDHGRSQNEHLRAIEDLSSQLEAKERELRAVHGKLRDMQAALGAKDDEIDKLKQCLMEKDEEIAVLQRKVRNLERDIQHMADVHRMEKQAMDSEMMQLRTLLVQQQESTAQNFARIHRQLAERAEKENRLEELLAKLELQRP